MIAPLGAELIARIRTRAADPATRTDSSPTHRGQTISVGGLTLRSLDLGSLLRGDPNPTPRPAAAGLPPPATVNAIAAAEAALGFALPVPLRQLLADVADGGFGPGAGLMSLSELVRKYQDRVARPPGRRGQAWPPQLLPFTRTEPGHDCINRETGRIILWDEEMLADGSSDKVWKKSFKPDVPDLATWFDRWLGTKSPEQAMKDQMQASMRAAVKQTIDYWRAKSPAERKEFGLPDVGWEQELFGHLGMDLSTL